MTEDDFPFKSCEHCGCTETLSANEQFLEHTVCEYDLYCQGCFRHVGFYAYGAFQKGSGEPATDKVRPQLRKQIRDAEEQNEYLARMDESAAALADETGCPQADCLEKLFEARGDRERARALLGHTPSFAR